MLTTTVIYSRNRTSSGSKGTRVTVRPPARAISPIAASSKRRALNGGSSSSTTTATATSKRRALNGGSSSNLAGRACLKRPLGG